MNRFSVVELLNGIQPTAIAGDVGARVSDIVYDSRRARPDTVFVAVRGQMADGHSFVAAAARGGCRAFVVEEPVSDVEGTQFVVEDARAALASMSATLFGHPSEHLSLAGITGTNGKTTTAFMLESIYRAADRTAGLIGTVEYRIAGKAKAVTRTTPESYDLQKLLAEMVDAGVSHAALEVSSHAAEQKRVYGCAFAVKVFTNLSQDHLDYHRDMERYFAAKKQFMERYSGAAVVNADDEYGRRLAAGLDGTLTYAIMRPADYSVTEVKSSVAGCTFTVKAPDGVYTLTIKLPGTFNIENALAATVAARVQKMPWDAIAAGLEALTRVTGRFERIDSGLGFTVVIDYAHTPDSLAKAVATARDLATGKVITVFGCGGDRDRDKRPLMGRAASALSDVTIITTDNPRSEHPDKIISDIKQGIEGEFSLIRDRKDAIKEAISLAREGDIVLIAGKGHEKEQILKDRTIMFDDRVVVEDALKELAAP